MDRLKVHMEGALPGALNMQEDSDLLAAHQTGDDPILRLYRWKPAAVTIGYNQKFEDFDADTIAQEGFGLVRRPTGGRAIFHADELTYSVTGTSPGPLFGNTLHEAYMKINEGLVLFLQKLGLEPEISGGESREAMKSLVCFKSAGQHEIRVGGRKIIGSAQRRTGGVFLQHGSILTGPRHLRLPEFLLPGQSGRRMSPEQLAAATTDLGQLLGKDFQEDDLREMEEIMAGCFGEVFGLELDFVGA